MSSWKPTPNSAISDSSSNIAKITNPSPILQDCRYRVSYSLIVDGQVQDAGSEIGNGCHNSVNVAILVKEIQGIPGLKTQFDWLSLEIQPGPGFLDDNVEIAR